MNQCERKKLIKNKNLYRLEYFPWIFILMQYFLTLVMFSTDHALRDISDLLWRWYL